MIEVTVTTTPSMLLSVIEVCDYAGLCDAGPELSSLMAGVQEKAESYVGRSFTERTIELRLDCLPHGGVVRLPRSPVISITSVSVLDESDLATVIDPGTYYMADNERLVFTESPDIIRDYGGLLITFVAGSAGITPVAMKTGMLKALASINKHREDFVVGNTVASLPDVSYSYLDTWRVLL